MSNRKAYLVHLLIFSVLYFMGSSLAVPTLQRRDDEGGSLPSSDLADALPKAVDDAANLVVTTTPVQDPTTTSTMITTTPTSSVVSSSVTPTPTGTRTVELVPPVTVVKQLGTTAVVVASQGKTTTIKITASGASGLPSPTGSSSNQAVSAGIGLRISASTIAVGFAIAVLACCTR